MATALIFLYPSHFGKCMNISKKFLTARGAVAALALICSAGAAQAQTTDILVNQEACAIVAGGADAASCPNSLDGPAGGNVRFTAKVIWNTGSNPGTVTVVEKLPIGSIFRSQTSAPAGASCSPLPGTGVAIDADNQTITCTLPAFTGSGDANAQRVHFLVTLPTISTGWKNDVTVSTTVPETDSSNNSLQRGYTTNDAADLQIGVVTNPATAIDPGEPYTQTITVTNNGPTAIPSNGRVVVGFTVPTGAAVTDAGGGSSGWACLPDKVNNIWAAGTEVTCTRPGSFANGATDNNLVITGAPNVTGTVTAGYSVQGWENATKQMPDGQPDNNTDNVVVTVNNVTTADMTITKTRGGAATRALGEEVTYTITPRLLGGILPEGAVVTVEDHLPAGLTFVSATGADWNTGVSPWEYTVPAAQANYSNLPALTVKAIVTVTGAQKNEAEVGIKSGAIEVNPTNNKNEATVTGSDTADLRMTKTASNYVNGINVAVQLNTLYTYTLGVTNNGPLAIPAAAGNNPEITLTEKVPAGVTIQSVNTANGWTCSPTGGFPVAGPQDFDCTYAGGLANGGGRTLVLNAIRTTEGNVRNEACTAFGAVVGTPTRKDNQASNDCDGVFVGASDSSDPDDTADLQIIKTADKTELFAGEDLTYTLKITNNGPAAATNVKLRDQLNDLLPSGATLTALTGLIAGQTCTPARPATGTAHTLECDLGTLAASAEQTITVTVKPLAIETNHTRSNTAHVYSETVYDPTPENNQSTVPNNTQVKPRVDLHASKEVTTSEGGAPGAAKNAASGSKMLYTVRATNDGPSSAENVWLRDPLPAQALLLEAPIPVNAGTNGGVCQVVEAATSADYPVMGGGTPVALGTPGGVLECVWGDDSTKRYLARSGQYEVNYSMRSLPNLYVDPPAPPTELDNTVTIGTVTDEPNKTNNTATAKVTLTASELDVYIQMSHNVDAIDLGSTVRYSITLKNGGPTYATGVTMEDIFPTTNAGGDASSATFTYSGNLVIKDKDGNVMTDGSCVEPAVGNVSGPLRCTFPVLAPGEDRVIEFEMVAASLPQGAASGTVFHKATISAAETEWLKSGDNTADNNTTRDQTSTNRDPVVTNLSVVKTSTESTQVKPGENITYSIVVTNNGPLASTGAQVIDQLPTGLSFVSASGGTCAHENGKVACAVGTLANGDSITFTIVTKLANNYTGTSVVNKAVLDAPGDPVPTDNESEAPRPVTPPPAPIPVDNPIALLLLSLGILGFFARKQRRA